jgi:hypothetical protein
MAWRKICTAGRLKRNQLAFFSLDKDVRSFNAPSKATTDVLKVAFLRQGEEQDKVALRGVLSPSDYPRLEFKRSYPGLGFGQTRFLSASSIVLRNPVNQRDSQVRGLLTSDDLHHLMSGDAQNGNLAGARMF